MALVQLAASHWTKASYASQFYSENRKNAFITNPNSPRDPDKLHEELRVFDSEVKVVQEKKAELEQLSACFEEALRNKRIKNNRDIRNLEFASFQNQSLSLPAAVFQFQGAAGQEGQGGQGGQAGQAGQEGQGGHRATKRPRLQTGHKIWSH